MLSSTMGVLLLTGVLSLFALVWLFTAGADTRRQNLYDKERQDNEQMHCLKKTTSLSFRASRCQKKQASGKNVKKDAAKKPARKKDTGKTKTKSKNQKIKKERKK